MDSLDVSTDDANTAYLSELFAAIARYSCEEKVLINANNIYSDTELWMAIQDFVDLGKFSENGSNIDQMYRHSSSSILCVPIATTSSNGRVVGVIQAIYKENGDTFTEEDQMILEAVSSEVAHTIARNISDLCLQKYIQRHEDVPLDVIDYYLTGSYEVQRQASNNNNHNNNNNNNNMYSNYPNEWENDDQLSYTDDDGTRSSEEYAISSNQNNNNNTLK